MWNTPDGWLVDEDGSKVPASQYPNNSDSVTANIFMNGDYLANPINWKDVVSNTNITVNNVTSEIQIWLMQKNNFPVKRSFRFYSAIIQCANAKQK